MEHLLSASFIMASRLPLAHRDYIHQPHLLHLDMSHPEFSPKQQLPSAFPQPPLDYTSSPSLNSETDDDPTDGIFDVDMEYLHHEVQQQPQQQHHPPPQPPQPPQQHDLSHLPYDASQSPPWSNIATPRAWVGEPQKLSNLDRPDAPIESSSTSHLYPNAFADYFNDPTAPASSHSPPATFISSPSLTGLDSYYSASSPTAYRYSATASLQHNPSCDPRFVSPVPVAGPSSAGSPLRQDLGISFQEVYLDPAHRIKPEPGDPTAPPDSDSGEDEKSESEDPTYVHSGARGSRSRSAAALPVTGPRPTRTPAPEPVPNLTKKSRGRRVPTAASLYGSTSTFATNGKTTRSYVCKVRDCGKCFARSEHLKRHVRSIHTNEKPHRCPHPGCNKEFSRHDNLCQHMRVHRNYSAPKDGAFGAF